MYYIGIDPGQSGGIALITAEGGVVDAFKMPTTERDLLDALGDRIGWFGNAEGRAFAVIEKVGASPQMGVVSAFTFGKGYGALLMVLTALEVPFDQVSPQKWQLVMGCRSGGDKNVTKRRAQQLFPDRTVTHAVADALLIAEFCRRVRGGDGRQTQQDKTQPQGPQRQWVVHQARREESRAQGQPALAGVTGHGAGPQRQAR